MPEQVLYHHGVKGMKWGVRRENLAKAREAERQDQVAKAAIKKHDKLVTKHLKMQAKGKDSSKVQAKAWKTRAVVETSLSNRDKLLTGLDAKTVSKGKKQVNGALRSYMFTPIGRAMVDISEHKRIAKKYGLYKN